MNKEPDNNTGISEALAYEKEYIALLDQVKEKSTSEKIDFLIPRIEEIRDRTDPLIACDDYDATVVSGLTPLTEENKLISYTMHAYIIVYRYEHNISILKDLHLEISGEPLREFMRDQRSKNRELENSESYFLKNNEPEKYKLMQEYKVKREQDRLLFMQKKLNELHNKMTAK